MRQLLLALLLATPAALAAQAAAPTPAPTPHWEYGRLTFEFGGGGWSWTTAAQQVGDGNFGRFVAKLGMPELAKHPAAELAVLGALGAQGWELVSCQTAHLKGIMSDRDLTSCYLKRPFAGDSLHTAP